MHGIKQIFGKELARVFRDKKMIFAAFVLPVVMMYVIMSLVGMLSRNMIRDIDSHKASVCLVNAPESFTAYLDAQKVKYRSTDVTSAAELKAAKARVKDGKVDLIVEFPEDFTALVENYQSGGEIPQVKTYYNPSEDYSAAAYDNISNTALEGYRQSLLGERVGDISELTVFTVNSDNKDVVLQDEDKAGGKAAGFMLPYLITLLLFAGAMSIGTDMIAGEKERGTMASLLVSPLKRSSIALGKVFALMVIAGLSAIVYVAAMVLLAPGFSGGMMGDGDLSLNLDIRQIVMLGLLLIAIAFLYSSLIVLVSVFAKSVKEASSYIMPVYMLVLIVGLMTMFTTGQPGSRAFFIPIYNNTITLQRILTQEITSWQFGVTLAETLAIGIICQFLIVKAFKSEKLMSA